MSIEISAEKSFATSSALMARAQKVAPGGVHSPVRAFKSVGGTPVFFKSARGAYLTSVEGRDYLDYCMSFGPLILGHRDEDIQRVAEQALRTAWSFGACEPYSLELAEWITQRLPWVQKLRFVSSGTEAVMSALRVARAATGRHKILKFDGMYHGHVDSMLVKSGSGLAGEATSDSAGVGAHVAHDTVVCRLDDDEMLEQVFRDQGDTLAAVILEPLPANYGLLIQRTEFLQKIVRLARVHGALVIFDEVISGFRVAMGGMAELLKIEPDLVTYGKVMGGGFPVGCYGGRADLLDLVAPVGPVYQAGTLSANPVGMMIGLATLRKVETARVHAELRTRMERWAGEFRARIAHAGLPVQFVHYESLFWLHPETATPIRSVAQIPKTQGETFRQLFHGLLKRGIYLAPSGFEVGFLSLAHTDAILEQTLEAMLLTLKEIYAKP